MKRLIMGIDNRLSIRADAIGKDVEQTGRGLGACNLAQPDNAISPMEREAA